MRNSIYLFSWFGLMWASLQVQQIEIGHSFCGRWGCGPPAEAILSVHLFWLTAILPPAMLASRCLPLPWKIIGRSLLIVGIFGLIVFGFYDVLGPNSYYYQQGYGWQRYLLSLASLVDIPIMQVIVTGSVLAVFGRGCPCCSSVDAQNPKNNELDVAAQTGNFQ